MRWSVRWRLTAATLSAALLLGVVAGCSSASDAPADPASNSATGSGSSTSGESLGITRYPVADRVPLPEVAGPTLDGGMLDVSSLRGDVVVLNVWASYCGPCRTESPALAQLASDPALDGVRFVGLNERDQAAAARSFAQAAGTTYPHIVDADGSVLAGLPMIPPSAVPSTLIIDQQGRIAARIIGAVDADSLRRELVDLQRSA